MFKTIDRITEFYDGVSDTCFLFIPKGTVSSVNYAAYIFMSLRSTLVGIKLLLKEGNISDAFVLIRKYFDMVLTETYLNVVR